MDPKAGLYSRLDGGSLHPKKCKALLAKEIVARYHGDDAGEAAEAEFDSVHAQGHMPSEMPEHTLAAEGGGLLLLQVLMDVGLIKSKSEGRRKLGEGAVRVDGEREESAQLSLGPGTYTIQLGKKRFVKVTIEQ